jgi:hypothetical protein
VQIASRATGRRIDCRAQSLTLPRAVTALLLLRETVFNLCVDLVQPLLGTLSSVLIHRDFSFQLRNAICGSAKLMRELLSHIQRVSALLFDLPLSFSSTEG